MIVTTTASAFVLFAALQGAPQASPARVVIQPATAELEIEEALQLAATAYDGAGQPLALEGADIRWFSSDETIVSIDTVGQASAVRPGQARITAVIDGTFGFGAISVSALVPDKIKLRLPTGGLLAGTGTALQTVVLTKDDVPVPDAEVTYEMRSGQHVASVDAMGRVFGLQPGRSVVRARAGDVSDELEVWVIRNDIRFYEVLPRGRTVRAGDVIRFRVRGTSEAGEELGGFVPDWTVSGHGAQIEPEGTFGVFVADEPGTYRVTALIGQQLARSEIVTVVPRDIQGRLVEVGRGAVTEHRSGDAWVFEGVDGRDYAYIGTYMHDVMKVWDVTDPAAPVLTDSVRVDARRINDVKIHPNRRLAIITREGASNRKNGIVLLDLADPAHPTILSEYAETVTGGVHNVWILGEEELVYAVHNGTDDMHIIDISDPHNPREVGRWGVQREGKNLHDVIVQDGYAYLSYWDDGVIMLDAGAGTHGGTATEPEFVSQYKYPLGNTHVAWRYGRYVFAGDEIFPKYWRRNREAPVEARGYVHVIDYFDPEHPREVARYEVPEAGAHNLWVEDDRLYIGYYQGGLRVVDVSGELRGDLYRQGREIAVIKTSDPQGFVPNWPMAWSAQLYKGNIFTADMNSGLWITRLVESPPPVP